jgi:hypothetical protein
MLFEHYLVYGNGSDKNKGNLIYIATDMPENYDTYVDDF